jgi:hypothetical protein
MMMDQHGPFGAFHPVPGLVSSFSVYRLVE